MDTTLTTMALSGGFDFQELLENSELDTFFPNTWPTNKSYKNSFYLQTTNTVPNIFH